jgi:hypothetical protein
MPSTKFLNMSQIREIFIKNKGRVPEKFVKYQKQQNFGINP